MVYRWQSTGFDWAAFSGTFAHVNWAWLISAIPLMLLAYAVRAVRWQVMLRPLRPETRFSSVLSATLIGFTAIVFFGRAGELVRPYLIANKERVSFSSQVAAWLLERILDLMMVLLIFGIALGQISRSGFQPGPRMAMVLQVGGMIVGLTAAVCLGVLLFFRYFTEKAQKRLTDSIGFLPDGVRARIASLMGAFLQGMQSTRSNSYILQLMAYSLLEWGLIVICYLALLWGFPATAHFGVTDVVIFLGFVAFGAAIQLPGVGGGVQVASIFVFTEFFRLPLEVSTGLALVLWLISFVLVVPIGVVLAFREGLKWQSLSHISEEVDS